MPRLTESVHFDLYKSIKIDPSTSQILVDMSSMCFGLIFSNWLLDNGANIYTSLWLFNTQQFIFSIIGATLGVPAGQGDGGW